TGGALANLEDAEARDADLVALLEILDGQTDEIVEQRGDGLLRHVVLGRELGDELRQRNGGDCSFLSHGYPLCYGLSAALARCLECGSPLARPFGQLGIGWLTCPITCLAPIRKQGCSKIIPSLRSFFSYTAAVTRV